MEGNVSYKIGDKSLKETKCSIIAEFKCHEGDAKVLNYLLSVELSYNLHTCIHFFELNCVSLINRYSLEASETSLYMATDTHNISSDRTKTSLSNNRY